MISNRTWNQFKIKNGNKTLVLDTIRNHSPISRADVAKKTGLNKGTVSSQVSELLDEELIYEKGPGKSSGGRRPVMLLFNQKAGYSIGIDIGVNYILGLLTDLEGNIVGETFTGFKNLSYQSITKKIFHVVDELMAACPLSKYHIVGIGIGVPGAVNKHGQVLYAPNLGWQNIDLKPLMEKRYDCPVVIENEANAGAYGEKRFGPNVNENDLVYVSVGVGIGVGFILNGELYRGTGGFSGEMGHTSIEVNGQKCRCGNRGCWELYASEQALIKKADENADPETLEIMLKKAESGDKEAIETFHNIGKYLGAGVANIINSFNPKQVIIGNRLAAAKRWLENPMLEQTKNSALWFQQEELEISFSALNTHSAALGMAAFSFENFLKTSLQQETPYIEHQ
ncbi:ROK family transcriptional regulator [Halobacillus massiliensis]|uniref:ROK family transcriptional regulator n=1 Tax=Halobacillus massiliensis TaxID=1926286 RepID=UPI0009E2AD83|nr:ROK family transcriptional regulator [Halobacillus massiliensis]